MSAERYLFLTERQSVYLKVAIDGCCEGGCEAVALLSVPAAEAPDWFEAMFFIILLDRCTGLGLDRSYSSLIFFREMDSLANRDEKYKSSYNFGDISWNVTKFGLKFVT